MKNKNYELGTISEKIGLLEGIKDSIKPWHDFDELKNQLDKDIERLQEEREQLIEPEDNKTRKVMLYTRYSVESEFIQKQEEELEKYVSAMPNAEIIARISDIGHRDNLEKLLSGELEVEPCTLMCIDGNRLTRENEETAINIINTLESRGINIIMTRTNTDTSDPEQKKDLIDWLQKKITNEEYIVKALNYEK